MLTWSEFKLQEPIIKALTELGFKQPTKIQQLTLPAAIHGNIYLMFFVLKYFILYTAYVVQPMIAGFSAFIYAHVINLL